MKKQIAYAVTTLAMAITLPSTAQEVKQWTLDECIRYALEQNIQLQQNKLSLEESKVDTAGTITMSENKSFNDWKGYVKSIKNAESEFKSQDISFSLYRLSKAVDKVIDYLEKHPEKEKDVKKLMDFHLPSAVKLISSYKELQVSGLNTFNIEKTKEEIVSAVDKIQEAYAGVLEDLYNDNAIDVSADIQVLKMMLSREGFLDRDVFKQKK